MKLKVNCDKYTFNEAKHKHFINGREVTGTTTIVGVIDKPALIPWALKIAMECLKKLLRGEALTYDNLIKAIEHAKQEPNRKKNEAGRFGTVVHALCEHFNKTGVLLPVDSKELPESVLKCAQTFTDKELKKATKLLTQYIDWLKKNNAKILYVEQNVFSETYFLGGIFDMIIEIDGKIYLADFKTSSGVYPSHFIQMGGYEIQLSEMAERGYIPEMDIDGYIVLHVPRKGSLKEHRITDTQVYQRAFRACIYIYRLINDQKWAL